MDAGTSAKDLFNEALERPPQERAAFLDAACDGDETLRARVERLLAAHERHAAFLLSPTGVAGDESPPLSEGPGTTIGRYRLLQLIGEGGFGSVFMAEQREPVARRVALKIIKLGMDTRQVIARFEAERQALAMMDHPGIARVFDAGATESGRPYFVMELVRGEPITAFCDHAAMDIRGRLELFQQVCHAVQHAHQKGIIHRDLKPSNILVGEIDGKPAPKIIDFGIAKATGGAGALTDKTLFTDFRQFVGTPEYMSPEQAGMGAVDIDTRSDIYSLGVLLYELLTGGPPFDAKRLRSAAWDEMLRVIREEEPAKPSTRLSSLREALPSVAASRRTEPARLTRSVRGDLDWIAMKCLEKDRPRRYESAAGLAADIGRHLCGEAVLAAPPSRGYRVRKFLRRQRVPVITGALVALSLLAAVVGTTTFALREARQRANADKRAQETEKIAAFQEAQITGIGIGAMGEDLRSAIIERRRESLRNAGLDDAAVERELDTLRESLRGVNFTDVALESLERHIFDRALSAVDEQFSQEPLLRARMLEILAWSLNEVGIGQRAVEPLRTALEVRRLASGQDDQGTIEAAHLLAIVLADEGQSAEAESLYRDALDRSERVLGPDHVLTMLIASHLGSFLFTQGEWAEGEEHLVTALAAQRRVLGNASWDTLTTVSALGNLRREQGRLDEAEACFREALAGFRILAGDEQKTTLGVIHNLGALLQLQGRLAEAEPLLREAAEKMPHRLGSDHPDTLLVTSSLGTLLRVQGRLDEAEPLLRATLEQARRALGDDHPNTVLAAYSLGVVLKALGNLVEAEALLRESVEGARRVLGPEDHNTLTAVVSLAGLLHRQGRYAEAEPMYVEALNGLRGALGEEHASTLIAMNGLGSILLDQARPTDAIALLEPAEPAARAAFTAGNTERLSDFLLLLGRGRVATGAYAAAVPNLTEAHSLIGRTDDVGRRQRNSIASDLVRLYEAWHEAEPDEGHDAEAAAWRARVETGTPEPGG